MTEFPSNLKKSNTHTKIKTEKQSTMERELPQVQIILLLLIQILSKVGLLPISKTTVRE